MNIVYKWMDDSTYFGGNPQKPYNKGDIVPIHIFPEKLLKQFLMYGKVVQAKPAMISPVKLSISIMAHPSRASFFPRLKEKLGDDVPFSIDQKNNLLENCKAAWRLR